MADFSLVNAVITVFFGAVAGGVTNFVAIWMLFHPYDPRGVGRLKVHGAIPKNKARLAKTIGRTVGQRLITPGDLAEHLGSAELQAAFETTLRGLVSSVLSQERGSLRDEMPPPLVGEIEKVLHEIIPEVAERLQEYAGSDDFRETVIGLITRARTELSDHAVGEILTAERRRGIMETADSWVAELVSTDDFEYAISSWLDRQLVNLANDHTPLIDRMPPGLVAAVEKSVAGYIPEALDKLGEALSNKKTRARIEGAMHDLFRRFAEDLLIHERIVAKLVVTEKTISRLLDTFEKTGADKISSLLEQPEMRDEIARSVNKAIDNFLRRPVSHHFDHLGPERVVGIKDAAQANIVRALRDRNTRAYAIDRLDQSLRGFEHKTWGELLSHLPPEKAAELASNAASSDQVKEWLVKSLTRATSKLLERPIGRPDRWLDENLVNRISDRMYPALWNWTQNQVPMLVAQIDVQSMVEEKVLGFSLQRIEELVRSTTQRELNVIIYLGWVLGALVGASAYVVSLFLS